MLIIYIVFVLPLSVFLMFRLFLFAVKNDLFLFTIFRRTDMMNVLASSKYSVTFTVLPKLSIKKQ